MEQTTTKRLWTPLPYFYFSKPGIKIILREKNGDRLFLLYMQLLCLAIQNDGKVVYSQACPSFTPYTLAISLEGNFSAQEINEFLPILKARALIDYPEPEDDPSKFKLDITILDFGADFPLQREAVALEREEKLEEQSDASSKKKITKVHHQFTQQLIDSEFITNQDRSLPDYDSFFTSMVEKYEKHLTLDRMKEAVDEIIGRYKSNPKVTAKAKWFFKCYENLLTDWRQSQVFDSGKEKKPTKKDDYSWDGVM